MARREKMDYSDSKRLFSRTARKVHPKNGLGLSYGPSVRGGIRF